MARVLLLTDNTTYKAGAPRYLGTYRLAHGLESHGIHTDVIDHFYLLPNPLEVIERTLTEDVMVVGLSSTFMTPRSQFETLSNYIVGRDSSIIYRRSGIIHADIEETRRWLRQLREIMARKSPKAKLIIGGAKAKFFMERPFDQITEYDYLCMGSVDLIFHRVVEDIVNFGEPATVQVGGKRIVDTLNTYQQPKSCAPHDWKEHWCVQKGEALPIEIARGCVFNCKFCHYDKSEAFRKNPEDLKAEFINNFERYGTQFYHFTDDCINDNKAKVEMLCSVIDSLPFKIEWVSYARFDVAVKFPETARAMVESGARGLFWGIESLNYEVARRAGKGTPPDKIKRFLTEFYRDYGDTCLSTGSIICGLPGETKESWQVELEWLLNSPSLHFLQIGALSLLQYRAELDMKATDYADYSRHPEKYGFEEVSFSPVYWRHKTMDLPMAENLARESMKLWQDACKPRAGLVTDIWIYPHLRSLGFSPEEVRKLYFCPDEKFKEATVSRIREALGHRVKGYFQDLSAALTPPAKVETRCPAIDRGQLHP